MLSLRSLIDMLNRRLAQIQAPAAVHHAAGDRCGAGAQSVIPYLREARDLQEPAAESAMEPVSAPHREPSL